MDSLGFRELLQEINRARTGNMDVATLSKSAQELFGIGGIVAVLANPTFSSLNFFPVGDSVMWVGLDSRTRILQKGFIDPDSFIRFCTKLQEYIPVGESAKSYVAIGSDLITRYTLVHSRALASQDEKGKSVPFMLFVRFIPFKVLPLEILIETKTIPEELANLLVDLLIAGARGFVCGPANTGKSTLAIALVNEAIKKMKFLKMAVSVLAYKGDSEDFLPPEESPELPELPVSYLIVAARRANSNFVVFGEIASPETFQLMMGMCACASSLIFTMHGGSVKEALLLISQATGVTQELLKEIFSFAIVMRNLKGGFPVMQALYVNPVHFMLSNVAPGLQLLAELKFKEDSFVYTVDRELLEKLKSSVAGILREMAKTK